VGDLGIESGGPQPTRKQVPWRFDAGLLADRAERLPGRGPTATGGSGRRSGSAVVANRGPSARGGRGGRGLVVELLCAGRGLMRQFMALEALFIDEDLIALAALKDSAASFG